MSTDTAREFFERAMGDDIDPGHRYLDTADPTYLAAYQDFAKVLYGRTDAPVPPPTRALLVICLLAATRDWDQMRLHLRRGLRDGLAPGEILHALEITANAVGQAAIVHGARILAEEAGAATAGTLHPAPEAVTVARNIETFRRLQFEVIVGGKLDDLEQFFAPTFVTKRAGLGDLMALSGRPEGANRQDLDVYETFRTGLAAMKAALPDQSREIEEIHGTGNVVFAKWHISARHAGAFLGREATDKRIEWTEVALLRFDDQNRITEGWFLADELNLAVQLGLSLT